MTASSATQPDSSALWDALTVQQRAIILHAAASATEEGSEAFLVGGPVRDLLRGDIRLHDIDIVTTADACQIARRFARRVRADVAKTTDFGTATVHLSMERGITSVDFATARIERYPRPGILPVVTFPADINADLHRRDITINAMALPITPKGFGALRDPTGGLTDLRHGVIRILHDVSFRDDPTRLYRVARYAARFGFTIEPHTARLLDEAVIGGALTTISADRKRRELERALLEPDVVRCFTTFNDCGLLLATSHPLIWDDWIAARIPRVAPPSFPVWAFFVCRQDDAAVERLVRDLSLGAATQQTVRRLVQVWRARDFIAHTSRLSTLRPLLEKLREDDVLSLLLDEPAALLAAAFYERLRHIQHQDVRWRRSFGNYLKERHIAPGPMYRDILDALRDGRLDGDVETLEEAERFLRTRLGE